MATTELGVKRALKSIVASGFRAPPDLPELLIEWRKLLDDITDDELAEATREYLRSGKQYFPKPGQLRQAVIDARLVQRGGKSYASTAWKEGDGPCPVCGASLRMLTPDELHEAAGGLYKEIKSGRFGVLHEADAHARAGVPVVGYSR